MGPGLLNDNSRPLNADPHRYQDLGEQKKPPIMAETPAANDRRAS
jgi:hypothetical protein